MRLGKHNQPWFSFNLDLKGGQKDVRVTCLNQQLLVQVEPEGKASFVQNYMEMRLMHNKRKMTHEAHLRVKPLISVITAIGHRQGSRVT